MILLTHIVVEDVVAGSPGISEKLLVGQLLNVFLRLGELEEQFVGETSALERVDGHPVTQFTVKHSLRNFAKLIVHAFQSLTAFDG